MEIIQVYKCFCDVQRLRILNLLKDGPLCVCHLIEILDTNQVKVSKQLRYMKDQGMVTARREAQWMIYELADPNHPLVTENLKCLQDCAKEYPFFVTDLKRKAAILKKINAGRRTSPKAICC